MYSSASFASDLRVPWLCSSAAMRSPRTGQRSWTAVPRSLHWWLKRLVVAEIRRGFVGDLRGQGCDLRGRCSEPCAGGGRGSRRPKIRGALLANFNDSAVIFEGGAPSLCWWRSTGLNPSPRLEVSAAIGSKDVAIGGEIGFDTSSSSFTKCNAGISYNKPDFSAVLILWLNTGDAGEMVGDDQAIVPKIPAGPLSFHHSATEKLAKIYAKYQEAADALRYEQLGRKQSQAILERVLYEIEEKAAVIMDEKEEHERFLEVYSVLDQKLQQTLSEHSALEFTIQELKASLKRQERDYAVSQKEILTSRSRYPYLAVVLNFSQSWALYCLVHFYAITKNELAHMKPLYKFLMFKSIVFLTWWQGVAIALLYAIGRMGIAFVVHLYVFPAKPYEIMGDRISGSVAVLGDYGSVDCPLDPDEVRDSERPTKLRLPQLEAMSGMTIRESVKDVFLGGVFQHFAMKIVNDVKFTVTQAVNPVENGITKFN
ncbi:hypothetical protein ACS0TY_006008 [Phlomoides rotata]